MSTRIIQFVKRVFRPNRECVILYLFLLLLNGFLNIRFQGVESASPFSTTLSSEGVVIRIPSIYLEWSYSYIITWLFILGSVVLFPLSSLIVYLIKNMMGALRR